MLKITLIKITLVYSLCQVSSLDSDDGEDGKQMPSESDAEEEFPSFSVTTMYIYIITYIGCHLHVMLTAGATKTEDSGESSAAASKTKP